MDNQVSLPRILIYQDEDCSIMTEYLRFYGYEVINSTEEDIMSKMKSKNFDLCILSHYKASLPGDLRLLKALRKIDKKVPIIFVSDQSRYEYILEAFDMEADDYVIRPYNLEELIRRIRAVLRRCGIRVRTIDLTYQIGKYIFNTKENTLAIDEAKIKLTERESKTLALLCAYKDELLPRKVLMQHVWTEDNFFNKRSLDVHICNLRSYLRMDELVSIETKRGLGYSLVIEKQ